MSFGVRAGGSVGHVAGVVNALHDAGAKITLITNEPAPMIRSDICEAHPQGLGTFGLPSQANIFRMQSSTVLLGIQEANRHKPDFIYQRLTLGDCSGAILSHRLGVPLIVEYNGSEIWCNKNWGAGVRYAKEFARAEEVMLRSAAVVFTISQVLYNELLSRGLPPNRVGWYPNGIDPNVFNPKLFPENIVVATRRLLGFSNDEFVMTFVGTFGDWHGADVFARSAVEICSREGGNHGKGLRFLFIGDGKNRARCEAIVRDNFAKERCTFLGLIPQEQTPQYLAVSDCFVSPHVPNPDGTEFFGSPTKLFEYMAMGKSIIASKLGQIGDVLEDGKTGIVVKPGDVKELSAGLQLLHADPVLREKLGATARQTALKLYTWGAHIEALRKCIV